MRHRVRTKKLNRNKAHREALLRNLAKAIILKQSIITTAAKAKEAKRFTERLITFALKEDGNSHRRIFKALGDKKVVKKLFSDIVPQLGGQKSGHLRIIRTGQRKGDGAEMALIEFVFAQQKQEKVEKGKKKTTEKPKARRMPRLGRRKAGAKSKKEEAGKKESKEKKAKAKEEKKAKAKEEKKAKAKEEKKAKKEAKPKKTTRTKTEKKTKKKT